VFFEIVLSSQAANRIQVCVNLCKSVFPDAFAFHPLHRIVPSRFARAWRGRIKSASRRNLNVTMKTVQAFSPRIDKQHNPANATVLARVRE
jgi:hypothetical protein